MSLENSEGILKQHSSYNWVEGLEDFGNRESVKGLDQEFNTLVRARKCIPLFSEELEGRLEWFLAPDGTDDPKVLLRTEIFPDFLMPHPHRFSKLIYLNIWDANVQVPKPKGYYLKATLGPLKDKTLKKLRLFFDQKESTFYLYASRTIHRFEKQNQFLSIWDNEGLTSYWFFHTKTSEELEKLLTAIAKFPKLKRHIQPVQATATTTENYNTIKAAMQQIF